MSRDINDVIKEVVKNSKELHTLDKNISKDILELQKSIKTIEQKISKIDKTLEKLFDILNTITVFIEENDESDSELDDEEDWTPYDERNFNYDNLIDENYWNDNEDDI